MLSVAAAVFAAATVLYGIVWMASVRQTRVELGFDSDYLAPERALRITAVRRNSPAEQAGLRVGDRLVAINQVRIARAEDQPQEWSRHQPGDRVQVTVERPGQAAPLVLTGVFRAVNSGTPIAEYFAQFRNFFPVPFLAVGLAVLFLRLEDRNGWLLALLCASFIATSGFPNDYATVTPLLRPFVKLYQVLFIGMLGALFYWFFALFPVRSLLDRRFPWLKWLSIALGITFILPGVRVGGLRSPPPLPRLLGNDLAMRIPLFYLFGFVLLGLVSLAANFFQSPDPQARRKIRVIFWGTLIGVGPALVQHGARTFAGFQPPSWLDTTCVVLLVLFPLSFAYAVVKHRVLEIPALLQRSARYVLVQRGFTVLLSLASIAVALVCATSLARYLRPLVDIAQPSGIASGAVLGTALLWGGSQVHKRVSRRIDHAFFRAAYDARVILEDLAEQMRTLTSRGDLARVLEEHLAQALEPSSLVVYLREPGDLLVAASAGAPREIRSISANLPILTALARHGRPWEFPAEGEDRGAWAPLQPDILVPLSGRDGRLVGLLVLGARLSEEPYSGEDQRLLASAASQAGTTLENIALAEEIAQRLENERRAAREMEIAKEVQARLLPEAPPSLRTLDLAARCIEARWVGGDYYDFLELDPDRVGLVLADVSGKGVHAALLMANLQAQLRSLSAVAPLDPVRVLQQVNRTLSKSTAHQHYATLFFGVYEESTRRLAYVNCGHTPPVWLRRDGTAERLGATATVVGLFENWECSVAEIELLPGDLLAIFSDGVTEATPDEEAEYGDARLIEELRANLDRPAEEIVTAVLSAVQRFGAGVQSDDLTLMIARARA